MQDRDEETSRSLFSEKTGKGRGGGKQSDELDSFLGERSEGESKRAKKEGRRTQVAH